MPTQKKSGNPANNEKLTGTVTLYSNSPFQATGYGQQGGYLVDRLKRHGADVAALSNYGLEGITSTLKTAHGEITHYARGMDMYSNDVAPNHHINFSAQFPNQKNLLITLYDVWVMQGKGWDNIERIASWVPLDHVTMPPLVEKWLRRDNVTPIAMAPFGVEQMAAKGIECEYVPHAIETKIFKPTENIGQQKTRDYMGITDDQFLVGIVAANKSSGLVHRKAFSENLLSFSIFRQKHPDAVLYLHTDPVGPGGWNLLKILSAYGIPKESVLFPAPMDYRYGMTQEHLASLYTAMDVLLAPCYGGGFELPIMEAQACGTRVITSSWTAPKDLVSEDGWLVEGQPQWDSGQDATWMIPNVSSTVNALEAAYKAERGTSQKAIDFAKGFDVEHVWHKYWMPTLKKLLK
jgi:glycosyltransferase involved in cell wall biosynthesis